MSRLSPSRLFPLFVAPLLLICSTTATAQPLFTDIAEESGLSFRHFNGMLGEMYFPEMTGQGGALFDYDGDGDLDVYLVQGSMLAPGKTWSDGWDAELFSEEPRDRLFRNDLQRRDGALVPRFVDVTDEALLDARGYGMGVAAGDYDGDGHVDLFVANYGPNQLWRNRGDGTFEDVTAASGVAGDRWSTSAAFADIDGDGVLDLYIANYVTFSIEKNPRCYATSSRRDYCGPSAFPGQGDRLLYGRGDGTFEDVTTQKLGKAEGPGLGVVAADFDGNGKTDLYVANDGSANFLWLQQPDGRFFDDALLAGVAVNRAGQPEASMGLDAGDFDGDGDLDLLLAHLDGETNTLYRNDGGGLFTDVSAASGLGPPSLPFTAFGGGFLDVDGDALLDVLMVNGAVRIQEDQAREGDVYPLDQTNQLFRNLGGGKYSEWTNDGGPAFAHAAVSRGTAFGDVDRDGDDDVLLTDNNGPAVLLRNNVGQDAGFVALRARDGRGVDALGAAATAKIGDLNPLRRLRTDGSYCSSHAPEAVFGLDGGAPEELLFETRDLRRRILGLTADRRYLLPLP